MTATGFIPSGTIRRRPHRFTPPADTHRPIATINTTPLIDMMLVLLIMFIVAIPLNTHKVPLELPPPGPGPTDPRPIHRLDIDGANGVFWDGRAITTGELRARLAAMTTDPAEPALHLAADGGARYELVDQILADVQRAGVTRLGFVNNAQFEAAIAR